MLNGAAVMTASTGISNVQINLSMMSATASGAVAGDQTGLPSGPALNGSSVNIAGNTITALARGNAATNHVSVSAGGGSDVGGSARTSFDTRKTEEAQAAVLNSQTNIGSVTAAGMNSTYQVAFNSGEVSNGSIGAGGSAQHRNADRRGG